MSASHLESIGSQQIDRMVQFRVKPGSDLLAAIREAIEVEGIRAGVIVSGLGALQKAVFRNLRWFPDNYPVTPQDRLYLELEQPMELVSLMGWIAVREGGGAEIHAHFAASMVKGDDIVTLGGHLTEGTVCGIKTAVAILVLADDAVYAAEDGGSRTFDIFFRN